MKKIILFLIALMMMLGAVAIPYYFGYGTGLLSFINNESDIKDDCYDGRGTDIFFDADNFWEAAEGTIVDEEKFVGISTQLCEDFNYQIVDEGKVRSVKSDRFYEFIEAYNKDCDDCLIIQRNDRLFRGEMYKYSSDILLCESPVKNDVQECVGL